MRARTPRSGRSRRSAVVAGRLARPRRRLRAGLLQLLCVAAGLGLGLMLPLISTGPSVASTRVAESLIAVGFGILGLTSLGGSSSSTRSRSSAQLVFHVLADRLRRMCICNLLRAPVPA